MLPTGLAGWVKVTPSMWAPPPSGQTNLGGDNMRPVTSVTLGWEQDS